MATAGPSDEPRKPNQSRSGPSLWSAIRSFFGFKGDREATSERREPAEETPLPLSVPGFVPDTHLDEVVHGRHSSSNKHTPKSQPQDLQISHLSPVSSSQAAKPTIPVDDGAHSRPSNHCSLGGDSFVDLSAPEQDPQQDLRPELTGHDHSNLTDVLNDRSYIAGNPQDLSKEVTDVERRPAYEGGYSTIYRGKYNGQVVAVKVIRAVKDTISMRTKLYRNLWEWRSLDHINILRTYGVIHKPEYGEIGGIISAWCENADAERYLATGVALSRRVALLRDAASGLSHLHKFEPAIVHGDLRPSNILIDGNLRAKVCDFGLVRLIQEDHFTTGVATTTESAVTARYLAFELIEVDQPPTTATDVWALGCVGFEFIYNRPPYAHIQTNQTNAHYKICRDIAQRVPPATRPNDLNDTLTRLWDLLQACWNTEPDERPAAEAVNDFLEQSGDAIIDSGIP